VSDAKIISYLEDNGYPPHLIHQGRAGLVRRWREFVEQVEKGYRAGLEDYRKVLDIRGILEQADGVDAEVRTLDERLKKLLVPAKNRLWESASRRSFLGSWLSSQCGQGTHRRSPGGRVSGIKSLRQRILSAG
jgi:hypothetical protein